MEKRLENNEVGTILWEYLKLPVATPQEKKLCYELLINYFQQGRFRGLCETLSKSIDDEDRKLDFLLLDMSAVARDWQEDALSHQVDRVMVSTPYARIKFTRESHFASPQKDSAPAQSESGRRTPPSPSQPKDGSELDKSGRVSPPSPNKRS